MKIIFQAFQWECTSSELTLKQFLTQYKHDSYDKFAERKTEDQNNIHKKIHYFVQDNDIWSGVIISVKNEQKFTKLIRDNDKLVLDIHALDENERIADFNFFVLDSNTGYGMYQYYHHSCSLASFNHFIFSSYTEQLKELRKKREEELPADMSEKEKKKKLSTYNGKLRASIIERKGSFLERIEKMKSILKTEVTFKQMESIQPFGSPLSSRLKSVKYTLGFEKESPVHNIIADIKGVFSTNEFKKAIISGTDESGYDVIYRLSNDYDRFGEYEYEDMLPSLVLDEKQLKESILQNKIIIELKNKLPIFMKFS